jgi:N-acyl-D-amino-acid deacylase
MLDLLIRGANIVDGTGNPGRIGDVGIQNGKIVLGPLGAAAAEVDAAGLTLTPGFIDSHSHGDMVLGLPDEVVCLCKVSQGVTTEVVGQCGGSSFPISSVNLAEAGKFGAPFAPAMQGGEVAGFAEYLRFVDELPKVENYAFLCGHSTLRSSVLCYDDRAPNGAEMALMKQRLREALEHGAIGLSSGLIYPPGCFADTAELIALCGVVAEYDGVYATHMRSESDNLVEATLEAIEIARKAGVRLQISHHKACGERNWGKTDQTLRAIHENINKGVRITLDQYPYEAGATGLTASLPNYIMAGGMDAVVKRLSDPVVRRQATRDMLSPDNDNLIRDSGGFGGVIVTSAPKTPEAEGLTLAAYAEATGKDPYDAYFDLIVENGGNTGAISFEMDINEVERVYLDENTVVGSDGLITKVGQKGHPRAFGALTHALTCFCKERKLLSFEEAVRKQTGLPAERYGLKGKGLIEDGADADLVLLDFDRLRDTATYQSPNGLTEGIAHVFVAGAEVYAEKSGLTGAHPGAAVLR